MTSILKPFLGFTLTFTCAISAHAEELAKKTCLIVGTEQAVEESAACPGTVAEVLRSIEIEKERPMRDADGKIVIGTDGNAVLEQYTETYKLMASFAASAGLGDAMNGGEVPKLHNGMLENNTITVFAIKDSILAAKVEDAIATAKSNSATPLTVKDKTLIIHKIVGSQIATRPYYKDNMWNGQMEYKSLGGDPIKTNFLREDGDIANGMPFQQMDVLASNGVIHLMN
ncbi:MULTISPECIES: hypothetical protein [unclassified Thalassospira]|uniref:hypothetical protein n=1 Tax=unclassified Thalassospira TaxID=2648997 RepID=UPI001B13526B|nr:hypothetical protein [Thalassospira sp.]MBO6773085.1 hypothetical protein [Thalassospira sp.]